MAPATSEEDVNAEKLLWRNVFARVFCAAGSPLMAAVPTQAQTFSVAWDAPGGTGPAPQVR